MTSLTRRYRFSASHRLHSAELSEAENARVYGKCNNPFGHGHDYVLEVTVGGPVHPLTGLIVSVHALDDFIERHVLRLFANRNLNLDVAQFAALVPTTENIALVIADLIQRHWHDRFGSVPAGLRRVHIQETDRNGFEILLGVSGNRAPISTETESVTVHG